MASVAIEGMTAPPAPSGDQRLSGHQPAIGQ
jgi:hypothetical protein